MLSSGMLRRVALVGTDVSEERIAFIIRVISIGKLGTMLIVLFRSMLRLLLTANVVPSSPTRVALMEAIRSSDSSYKYHTA
jgi:hypothetical protein